MRQACKNILYVVGNSGYYADGDPTGGIDNMTKTFIGIDVAIAIVLIAIEAIVIVRWLGKKKKAAQ
jgi:beta-glucosidase